MILDTYLDTVVTKQLREQEESEKAAHTPSGRLSASMLGDPLQWQILKIIGVPDVGVDDYTLRKFHRGRDVEDWLIKYGGKGGVLETQKKVEYKKVVGLVDAVIDMTTWPCNLGTIPHEIKSVANAKYKWIVKRNEADHKHRLQATLYALALKSKHYAIDYIAADDYRIKTMIYATKDTAQEVEGIIKSVYKTLTLGVVPSFLPVEKWQDNPMYAKYLPFKALSGGETADFLLAHYPASHQKLQSFSKKPTKKEVKHAI